MIVDDSAFIRLGLRHYLENQDYVVHEAPDAATAMHLFEQQKIDIAILDISLQIGPDGIEGLGLTRKIKAKAPTVGVILLSGSANHYQEFLEISGKYRGMAYLYKGNNFRDELLAAIDLVNKGGVWVAPEIAGHEENSITIPLSRDEHTAIQNALKHFEELSEKEMEIVHAVAMSFDNKDIAEQKYIALNTVSAHMTHIYTKLGLDEEWSKTEKRSLLAKTYWQYKKLKKKTGCLY